MRSYGCNEGFLQWAEAHCSLRRADWVCGFPPISQRARNGWGTGHLLKMIRVRCEALPLAPPALIHFLGREFQQNLLQLFAENCFQSFGGPPRSEERRVGEE